MKKQVFIFIAVFVLASLCGCGLFSSMQEESFSQEPSSAVQAPSAPEETTPEETTPYIPPDVTVGDKVIPGDAKKANLSHMNLKELDIDMEEVINSLPNLKKLKLIDCGLSNKEYAKLQDNHPDIKIVWEVDLTYWKLRTDAVGFTTFNSADQGWGMNDKDAYYLKYCTDLVALDIGHNFVSDFSFLQYMPNLKVLILADNVKLDKDGYYLGYASDFSWLKYCPKLRYVEMFINDCTDLSFLEHCKEIEDLNICYSDVSSIEYLKDLPNLQRLWMEYSFVPYEEYVELTEIYPDATIVYYGAGSVDQGWREGDHYWAMRNMVINNVIDPVYED